MTSKKEIQLNLLKMEILFNLINKVYKINKYEFIKSFLF
jgi:hypothetical protein